MSRPRHAFAIALALWCATALAFDARHLDRSSGVSATALVAAMNRERAALGLHPLRLNEKLSEAAEDRVRDMMRKHYFSHMSPDHIDPFTWIDARGYRYTAAGENLAVGYKSAQDIVDGWMQSAAHRENVLKPAFDEIGIATEAASPDGRFSGPLVVAMYGSRH